MRRQPDDCRITIYDLQKVYRLRWDSIGSKTNCNPQNLAACPPPLGGPFSRPWAPKLAIDFTASVRIAAEARKEADRLACEAWNKRMLAFKGTAQADETIEYRAGGAKASLAVLKNLGSVGMLP